MDDISLLFNLLLVLIPGALFIFFPIYVLIRLAKLGHEVEWLKTQWTHRAQEERQALAITERTPTRVPPIMAPPVVSVPAIQPTVSQWSAVPVPATQSVTSVRPPFQQEPDRPHPAPKPEPTPTQGLIPVVGKRDIESLLGANWLAKLGVAAIAVAAAFFLQYAFARIGSTGQVAIGLVGAALLLGIGQYLLTKERYRAYAQVLTSGGVVVYYLSIYAAFSFYHPHLIGFGPAFTALVLGALAASTLALANDTEVVALLCILGAFAAPVLIREGGAPGTGSLLRLYAYLGFLNLWVAGLTRFRPWHSLSVLAFAGTWLLFFEAGPLKARGWETEGFAGLFLLASCYQGACALYGRKTSEEDKTKAEPADTMRAGLALIVGGCTAFAIASTLILTGLGLLGLPDVALAGLLLALLLAVLAVALPSLGRYDRPIRLAFGYLSVTALALMMATALETSATIPAHQVPIAFGFAVFNYLLFLAMALTLYRHQKEEGPATALVGANAVIHISMVWHVLQATRIWGIPALPLWLPLAGCLTLGGLYITTRQRAEARLLPGTLAAAAQLLPLCGLCAVLPAVAGPAIAHWPAGSVALVGFEFMLVSTTWLTLRRRLAWPEFRIDLAVAFGNAAVFFGLMTQAVGRQRYEGFALLSGCALAMAAYHACVGGIALRRDSLFDRLIYLGLAVTFVTIAIPLQLTSSYITLAWAVEAAVLVWTGVTVKESRIRWYGVTLLVLAAYRALFLDLATRPEHFTLLLNTRTLAGAAVTAAAYLSAWWLWKERERLSPTERRAPWPLCLAANLFTLLFVSVDLWDFVGQGWPSVAQPSVRYFALSAFWATYALAALFISVRRRLQPLRLFAAALLGIAAAKALLVDLLTYPSPFHLLLNTRLLAGALIILVAYLSAWMLWRNRETLSPQERPLPAALSVLANVLTLLFVSLDLWDYAATRWPTGGTASAQQLALSLFWTGYALAGVCVGIWKRLRPVRLFAMGLLYLSILKAFLFDLRNLETLYRIVSFFSLGVILLLVSLLYTRFEERLRSVEQAEEPAAPARHDGAVRQG
jgi:uncharacterized membrane protein